MCLFISSHAIGFSAKSQFLGTVFLDNRRRFNQLANAKNNGAVVLSVNRQLYKRFSERYCIKSSRMNIYEVIIFVRSGLGQCLGVLLFKPPGAN